MPKKTPTPPKEVGNGEHLALWKAVFNNLSEIKAVKVEIRIVGAIGIAIFIAIITTHLIGE